LLQTRYIKHLYLCSKPLNLKSQEFQNIKFINWWERDKLILWKVMSSIIFSSNHIQHNKWLVNIDETHILLGKANLRRVLYLQSFCCGTLLFCIFVLGLYLIFLVKHAFFFLSLFCFEIKICFFLLSTNLESYCFPWLEKYSDKTYRTHFLPYEMLKGNLYQTHKIDPQNWFHGFVQNILTILTL